MWALDRLAGQLPTSTSPQSNNRAISPLPHRTSSARGAYLTAQRPGFGTPRGSNLSLVSNDLSTSLLTASRRANGSSIKPSTPGTDGPPPQEVLRLLLGPVASSRADDDLTASPITRDDLEIAYDFGNLSLRELGWGWASSPRAITRNSQTVEDCERDKAKFEELHRSIKSCDDILASVETNLTSFRNDLATVSADIETLQDRSNALNVRLQNRMAVEKVLGPLVEAVSVSPLVVSTISEGPIDETWLKALAELDKRETSHNGKNGSLEQSKAMADLGPLIEKLVLKAIERIRDFLVAQIKALRSPNINAQIIQQQNFLRFKELFPFLHKHHTTLAEEICLAYMNTMRWYYANQFGRYEKTLARIKLHVIDKSDILGHDDTSRKTSVLSTARVAGPPRDAFSLGRRIDLLKTANHEAMSSYLAEEDQSTRYLEVPFRNFNLALIDNASAEYTFLAAFFSPALSFATISRHFAYIFEPTFALGQALTRSLISDTYDCLGLLLCVRINQHLAFELQRRLIPAADAYVNSTNMALWPRLQSVMDAHRESMRALIAALPAKPTISAANARNASSAPHVVTQRFGQLLHGILALSDNAGDEEPVVTSLLRLRSEVEAFLIKQSQASFGAADKRKRDRFLYNNYSLIATIISDGTGKLAKEQQDHFEGLKQAVRDTA